MPTLHAFDYLDSPQKYPVPPLCVAFGDEPFLKGLALRQVRAELLGQDDEGAPFTTVEGNDAQWRDVRDELATLSLFGTQGRRLVLVRDADDFVSKHRSQLEQYAAAPARHAVLLLEVRSWPGNTKLYKALDQGGLQLDCLPPQKAAGKRKVLDEGRLRKWLVSRAKQHHKVTLSSTAAELLLELVGPELGILDQGLAKLALFVEPGSQITTEMVQDVVGGWRAKTIWELLDLAADGNAGAALQQLDRLIQSGEHPIGLLAQISWGLRRYTGAVRIFERAERHKRRLSLSDALVQAGFRRFPPEMLRRSETQLRNLGRTRAGQLLHWLLEADLALKGTHSTANRARLVLELLLVRLSDQLAMPQR